MSIDNPHTNPTSADETESPKYRYEARGPWRNGYIASAALGAAALGGGSYLMDHHFDIGEVVNAGSGTMLGVFALGMAQLVQNRRNNKRNEREAN